MKPADTPPPGAKRQTSSSQLSALSSQLSLRLDAHQHFWRYTPAEYDWIDDRMRAIRRDFLPADLAPHLRTARLDGTIAVQARQSLAETDWLLSLADTTPAIRGVIGWVPLAREGAAIGAMLDHYRAHPRFVGVRHVLQAEPDAYFADASFNAALQEVARRELTYDLLLVARQLPAATALADRHPSLRLVVDHIAKPVVSGPPPDAWRAQLHELARRPHVFCKFSGVVTEIPDWSVSADLIRPYFDAALEAFGPARLMFGSDWPVCLVATDYARWHTLVESFAAPLSPSERAAILGATAAAFYRLTPALSS